MQGVNKQLADVNKQMDAWKASLGANGNNFAEQDFTGTGRDNKLKELQKAVDDARKALAQKPGDPTLIQNLKDAQKKLDTFHDLDKQKQSLGPSNSRAGQTVQQSIDSSQKQTGRAGARLDSSWYKKSRRYIQCHHQRRHSSTCSS